MITVKDGYFVLNTLNTTYAFAVMETGQLEHLYYGSRIKTGEDLSGLAALREQWAYAPGNTVVYDNDHKQFSLENICLEMSSYGKGDIREPFVCITHADGSRTSDFLYDSYEIKNGTLSLKDMPSSYDENGKSGAIDLFIIGFLS